MHPHSQVWSVVLYGAKMWTMRREDENKPLAFQMLVWRRIENDGRMGNRTEKCLVWWEKGNVAGEDKG
jgi:hypothetical protein